MATRVYALARELNVDSKDLLDVCQQAGIDVKSSALASLTDEERERVVALVKSKRETKPSTSGTLTSEESPTPIRRTDYVPASGVTTQPPPVSPPPKPASGPTPKPTERESRLGRKRGVPRPKVAAPPTMRVPSPSAPKTEEPPPQKPDIKLPPDAIRAGLKPLESHLRRHEERKHSERQKPPKEFYPPDEGTAAADRLRRPGPIPGREERKRRRGHRAQERRHKQDDELELLIEEERPSAPVPLRRRGPSGGVAVSATPTTPQRARVEIETPATMRAFSEATGIPVRQLLGHLLKQGVTNLTVNTPVDDEMAQMLAMEFGLEVEVKRPTDLEEEVQQQLQIEDLPENLVPRPPVVAFLGHVDHGKTSLLDYIRQTNVVAGEAGGITQHIGAYQVESNGQKVTFVDTPGHEAFTAMRARGARVTDIAVLVVAADDGIMPQTEEAISHARAANVPILVALNKIDLPNANVPRVLQQLASHDLLPAEWGGDTEVIQTSAVTGQGIDKLLETLIVLAELRGFKANPNAPASGVCLESSLSDEKGVLATFLVQRGTLRTGDAVLCGQANGRIKAMFDERQRTLTEAKPSTPAVVTGLDVPPEAGQPFWVVEDLSQARDIAESRRLRQRRESLGNQRHMTLETFFQRHREQQIQDLALIVKADTRGSLEAIHQELSKLEHAEVRVKLLHQGVGAVNENDTRLADASDAVILGFRVPIEEGAQKLADQEGVQNRRYDVIYHLTDDVRKALEGMIAPEEREVPLGRAEVLQLFRISRLGTVAGCRVVSGTIERSARVRVRRNGNVLGPYGIVSLRREKDDVREVREGLECGIRLAGFDDFQEGDVLEAFRIEEVRRTL